MVQHVVLFKWKPGVSASQQTEIGEKLKSLQQKIPGIAGFSAGSQSSPEGLSKGFHYGIVMTFKSTADRDTYLPHPDHKKVVDSILPIVDDVMVFDYEFGRRHTEIVE